MDDEHPALDCFALSEEGGKQLRVIHLLGSNESDFYFQVSFLYAKACYRFRTVEADYVVVRANGDAFLVRDSLEGLEVEDFTSAVPPPAGMRSSLECYPKLMAKVLAQKAPGGGKSGNSIIGPRPLPEILSHPALPLREVDLVVPHMFDEAGMTSYRSLFEDVLKISVAGPEMKANIISQNKVRTREVLKGVGVQIPIGQVLNRADFNVLPVALSGALKLSSRSSSGDTVATDNSCSSTSSASNLPVLAKEKQELDLDAVIDAIDLPAPFVIKAPTEDNSRGVFLHKAGDSNEALSKSLAAAFSMGERVLLEEFIPGREIRVAALEDPGTGDVEIIPAFCEYHLRDKDCIRTIADKLESSNHDEEKEDCASLSSPNGTLKQSRYASTTCPAKDISPALRQKIGHAVRRSAHALGLRDYSIFDFRVHAETEEPYLIESCTFWSFSPISFLSMVYRRHLMSGGLSEPAANAQVEGLVLSQWARTAERTAQMRQKAGTLVGDVARGNQEPSATTTIYQSSNDVVDVPKMTTGKVADTDDKKAFNVTIERLRCLAQIFALLALMPLSAALALGWWVAAVYRAGGLPRRRAVPAKQQRTVMLTGGKMSKALHCARCIWKAGHKVVLVETPRYWCSGSRFSRSVAAFELVTCPREDPDAYVRDMLAVARKHQVDLFIPVSSPAASVHDAKVKELLESTTSARSLHFTHGFTATLDDKYLFGKFCEARGLCAPRTYLVASDAEVRRHNDAMLQQTVGCQNPRFVLKNLEYDPMHRLDLFTLPAGPAVLDRYLAKLRADGMPVSARRPWQLQEFVYGEEYCAMVVLRDSRVRMVTVSASSASQLIYEALLPATSPVARLVERWVTSFANSLEPGINGQLCFDFIHDADQECVKVLECNPRFHSGSCVFASHGEQLKLGELLVDDSSSRATLQPEQEVLRPQAPSKRLYWFMDAVFKLVPNGALFRYNGDDAFVNGKKSGGPLRGFFSRVLVTEYEADFDVLDPLPFLLRNHFQLPILLAGTLASGNGWKKCDFCIGKVVEDGGD